MKSEAGPAHPVRDAADPATQIARAELSDRAVQILWQDGHSSLFHYLWLRYNCRSRNCGDPLSGVSDLRLTYFAPDIRPKKLEVTPDNRLHIVWIEEDAGCPECPGTVYDGHWLRAHCYSDAERARRRALNRPVLWDKEIGKDLPEVNYEFALSGEDGQFAVLDDLYKFGFVRVRGGPTTQDGLENVAKLAGIIMDTHFGKFFDIITKPAAQIVTDLPGHISLHTDNTYRHNPTGIHFFQGVALAPGNGGATILGDGFRIAEALRERDPDAFTLLTRTPQRFHRYLPERIAQYTEAPSISLDWEGEVCGFRYANRVTAAPLDLPEDLIEPMYLAQRKLVKLMDDPEFEVRFMIEPGDVLAYDNHRVLHGRTAFTETTTRRHLRRCATEREEFQSRYRLLSEKQGRDLGETPFARGALG